MIIATGYILSYLYLFGVIFGVGLIKKIFRLPSEWSRKLVHIFISFTWIILYRYLFGTVHFIVVPFSFVIINYFSYKYKIFKMYERDDGENNHYGTIFYAASLTIMAIISTIWKEAVIPYGIAVFCLSFGDGAAALVGPMITKHNFRITGEKSLFGTIACVAFAFIGIIILNAFVPLELALWQILLLSVATGFWELVGKGYDNFSIPGGIMILSLLL